MKIDIKHVAQAHKDAFQDINEQRKLVDQVAKSQLKVAHTIQKYPGCAVVVEGHTFNTNLSTTPADKARWNAIFPTGIPDKSEQLSEIQKAALYSFNINLTSPDDDRARVRAIFPTGLPDKFEKLNKVQKTTLYNEGACLILFYLKEIPVLYKSCYFGGEIQIALSQLNQDFYHGGSIDDLYERIIELTIPRETEAIECAIDAMLLNHREKKKISTESKPSLETRVLLVYGAAHDFKRYSGERYSKTLEKQVEITVEVIDCRSSSQTSSLAALIQRSPIPKNNKLFSTKALAISALIGSILSISLGVALTLTGVFAPLGISLMGLGITVVVSALAGAGVGVSFYMIGQKIKNYFSNDDEAYDVPPMSSEYPDLHGLSGKKSSYAMASRELSSCLASSPTDEPIQQNIAQANLSISANQLISESSVAVKSQTDEPMKVSTYSGCRG